MDMSKYKTLFLSEAREHLQGLNNCVLILEKDPGSGESINELFRHAHSIKGMSASMGYGPISQLSHNIEDLMDIIRKGQSAISPEIVDILLGGVDILEDMVDAIDNDNPAEELLDADYMARLKAIIESTGKPGPPEPVTEQEPAPVQEAAPVPQEVPQAPAQPEVSVPAHGEWLRVSFKVSTESLVPSARAYLAIKRLEELGNIPEVTPSIDEIKAGQCTGDVSLLLEGSDIDAVKATLSNLAEMGEFSVVPPGGLEEPIPGPEMIRAEGGIPGEKEEVKDLSDPASVPVTEVSLETTPIAKPPPPRPSTAKAAASQMVRVSTALLDSFINLVGELIVTKSRIKDLTHASGSRPLEQTITQLEQLVGSLHTEIMKVRMMPLETVTQRLPRVVRDLSKERGKSASLEIDGAEIELDRAILEQLGDPLIHILRNSVDHGLEDHKGRKAAGKDKNGKILLKAFRERDMVFIEVSDDGRGMDIEKIKSKAVEKGLISEQKATIMDEDEAIMLICRPGFSTAEVVTDVSGRGVGMDVVQSVVDSIGGSLSIESTTGEGTTFTLKLPLTVAIVKMLLVDLAQQIFAIPITRVVRTLSIPVEEVSESQGRLFLTLDEDEDEELIPLYELRELLSAAGDPERNGDLTIVLVEITNKIVGIMIDSITGQEDIVIKPLCYPLEHLTSYSGMTILGDGSIVPILDLGTLF